MRKTGYNSVIWEATLEGCSSRGRTYLQGASERQTASFRAFILMGNIIQTLCDSDQGAVSAYLHKNASMPSLGWWIEGEL